MDGVTLAVRFVLPAATPLTTPLLLTVAILGAVLVHGLTTLPWISVVAQFVVEESV